MNARFQQMIATIAARVDAPEEPRARYTARAVEAWQNAICVTGAKCLCDGLGLDLRAGEQSADWALALALADLGIGWARVVREHAYPVKREKAQRDLALDRPTIHLAPLWRYPLGPGLGQPAETGTPALMLPVGYDERAPHGMATALSLTALGSEQDFAANIADLVAIPLDGGRPMSMTGYTVAVGELEPVDGCLTIYGSGRAWLESHLAGVRAICGDTPGHLVEELHFHGYADDHARTETVGAPAGVLVLEPQALEWRVCRYDCVIPPGCAEVHCPDSRKLAEFVDQAMRKKEPVRAFPTVRGPALTKTEQVAA